MWDLRYMRKLADEGKWSSARTARPPGSFRWPNAGKQKIVLNKTNAKHKSVIITSCLNSSSRQMSIIPNLWTNALNSTQPKPTTGRVWISFWSMLEWKPGSSSARPWWRLPPPPQAASIRIHHRGEVAVVFRQKWREKRNRETLFSRWGSTCAEKFCTSVSWLRTQ